MHLSSEALPLRGKRAAPYASRCVMRQASEQRALLHRQGVLSEQRTLRESRCVMQLSEQRDLSSLAGRSEQAASLRE